MRLSSPSIQQLLNASERTLAASASASAVKDLSIAKLRGKVARARRLKDKYVGLARARGRVGRGKAQAKGVRPRTDVETMATKAAVFTLVLERFTTQLEKAERKAERAAAAPMTWKQARAVVSSVRERVARHTGAPAAAIGGAAASGAVAAESVSAVARSRGAKGARVEQKLAVSHVTRAQGHFGARTRRAQGKRDSR